MKSYFLWTILIFSIKFSIGQAVTTNPELDKFVGVWRWTSGADTMEITVQKQVYILYFTDNHSEILVGWHRYVKNGVLQQSSYQYIGRDINLDFNDATPDAKTTLLGTVYSTSTNKAYFYSFWDLSLHKSFNLWLTFLPGSTTQATWKLSQGRGGLYAGPSGSNGIYSMPKQLVLTKL